MATKDQLRALVTSHADGDDSQFYAVAMQVAAKAARQGRTEFAKELRDLVDELRRTAPARARTASVVPVAKPRGELGSLLDVSYPETRLSDLVLSKELCGKARQLLLEQRQQDVLIQHGLQPARRVLMTGPPGTGKTTTAKAIAGELGLPLFAVRLDTVITKYMGETAAKLRLVFDALAETKGIYLFDEIDALAGERIASNDVGEIRRVLNSFLQFLEEDSSESIVIGATNHPQLLDGAVFRRFDTALEFDLPDSAATEKVIANRLSDFNISSLDWSLILPAAKGLSHADIVAAAETAAKASVLQGRTSISTGDIVTALNGRARLAL